MLIPKDSGIVVCLKFIIFCCKFDTYLVTGSDRDGKTVEQVGLMCIIELSKVRDKVYKVYLLCSQNIYEVKKQ